MMYLDYNTFEKLRFQNGFRPHDMAASSNSSGRNKGSFSKFHLCSVNGASDKCLE